MGNTVVSYRQCAAQCLTLSRKMGDPADRELLVTMAQRWLDLVHRTHDVTGRMNPVDKGKISDAATTDERFSEDQ